MHEDNEFQDRTITAVEKHPDGSYEITHDGLCFYVPGSTPIEPKVGMVARFYGKGLGSRVRGLYIDGQKVFYRTEAEDKEQHEIEMYGADENLEKKLSIERFETIGGIPTPLRLEMKPAGRSGGSVVDLSDVQYDQELPSGLFDTHSLERGLGLGE